MRKYCVKLSRVYILISILYYIVLNWLYTEYVFSIFKYVGYECTIIPQRIAEGAILYIILTLVLSTCKDVPSASATDVFFFLSVAPFIVLYQYEQFDRWMVFYMVAMILILHMFLQFFEKIHPLKRQTKLVYNTEEHYCPGTIRSRKGGKWKRTVFFAVAAFFGFVIIQHGLPNFASLSFESISKVRAEGSFGTLMEIAINAMCRIVIPIILSVFLKEKEYSKAIIVSLIQLYIYSITGFKTYLFVLLLVVLWPFVKKLNMRYIPALAIAGVSILSVIIYVFFDNNMALALIADRVVFFPAKIKWAYLDFFSKNPFVLFSENSFSRLFGVEPVYGIHTHLMMGELYFNKPNMWTNTGYMTDAYANLGLIGGVLITALLSLELLWIDRVTNYDNKSIAAVIFFIFYIALNDGAFIYISGSGGLIIAIIIVNFLRKRKVL